MQNAARTYMATQVTTTSQGRLLIMLYEAAIKFLTQARERIEARDYAGKGTLISKAIDIVNELASSLNAEKGGDLAANLHQLYFYCNKRLFMANARMDTGAIDEVVSILDGIRSAYAQIVDTPEAVAAMASAPPPAGNPMRTPLNIKAAPVGGAPIPTAKAYSAYATQGASIVRNDAEAGHMDRTPAPQTPDQAPVPQTAAPAEAPPAPLELDEEQPAMPPAPSLSAAKRMATSALYKKFVS